MNNQVLQKIDELLAKNVGREVFTPGLARIQTWIKRYDLYPKSAKIVTICGTNGKGETTHALGYLLKQTERSYVQWTSPHILQITERFIANGKQIEADELLSLVQKWSNLLSENLDAPLSYYEILFIVFLDWQKALGAEFVLLEVGLGGRLDAVNALDANLVILTSISRDHQEFLGNSYKQILMEKLGVLREGITLVTAMELKYLQHEIGLVAEELKLNWVDLSCAEQSNDFSSANQSLAYAAITELCGNIPKDKLASFAYANRFYYKHGEAEFYLIGSHNPDGVRKLVQFLDRHHYNKYDVILLSFSKRDEKDLITMAKAASLLGESLWITTFEHDKAVNYERLKELLKDKIKGRLNFVTDKNQALRTLSENPCKVLVTGSYYFVGEVYTLLKRLGAGRE